MEEENKSQKNINDELKAFNKKMAKISIIIILVATIIISLVVCSGSDDLKYELRSYKTSGSTGTVIAYVENNTDKYVAYTIDVQIHDRYGEWVGYESGTIRLDPHQKEEYMITINCWSSDLAGSKAKLRVF